MSETYDDGAPDDTSSPSTETRDVTRRGYLKTSVAGAGFGVLGLRKTPDTTEIVTHESDGTPRKTKLVPAKWYEQKQHAVEVRDRLFDRYEHAPGIQGVGVRAGDAAVDGYRYFEVVVHVDEDRGTTSAIPEQVDGVRVRANHREQLKNASDCNHSTSCYQGDYDPIPGGVQVEDNSSTGSATCRVERDGTYFLMGARHVWVDDDNTQDSCSLDDPRGENCYQNGDYYGWVRDDFREYDALITQLDTDYGRRSGFTNTIVDEYGQVEGYITENGVDNMIADSNSRDVFQRGITHCGEAGQVEERENDYCSDFNRLELVRTTTDFGNGDSGAPVYDETEINGKTYLFIIHIATQYLSGCTSTFGSAAYEMNDKENIVFDT